MLDEAESVGFEVLCAGWGEVEKGGWGKQPSIRAERLKPSREQMHRGYKRCMIAYENTGRD